MIRIVVYGSTPIYPKTLKKTEVAGQFFVKVISLILLFWNNSNKSFISNSEKIEIDFWISAESSQEKFELSGKFGRKACWDGVWENEEGTREREKKKREREREREKEIE